MTFTNHPYNNLRKKFPPTFLTENGFNLLNRFLTYDPKKRISAFEALDHKYLKVGRIARSFFFWRSELCHSRNF